MYRGWLSYVAVLHRPDGATGSILHQKFIMAHSCPAVSSPGSLLQRVAGLEYVVARHGPEAFTVRMLLLCCSAPTSLPT